MEVLLPGVLKHQRNKKYLRSAHSLHRKPPKWSVTDEHELQMKQKVKGNTKAVYSGLPVLLVLQQLAVSTGQGVTGFTEKLQRLLLVDRTENRSLP